MMGRSVTPSPPTSASVARRRATFFGGEVAGILGNEFFVGHIVHIDYRNVQPESYNLDIPLDGILGNDVLKHFEWWYDYDGERLWLRPSR